MSKEIYALDIKEIRKAMGLTPEETADLLGYTYSTIIRYERNGAAPHYKYALIGLYTSGDYKLKLKKRQDKKNMINALRSWRNIDSEYVAGQRLGVDGAQIWRWEHGKEDIPESVMEKIGYIPPLPQSDESQIVPAELTI